MLFACCRVQVDDDEDYYDGPEHSENETDDSNGNSTLISMN